MNLFSFEHLLITISSFSLAIFIAKHAENTSHRIWSLFNCSVGLWSLGSFFAGLSKTPEQAIIYWRISYACGMFISTFFYHFVHSYFRLKHKFVLQLVYTQSIIFSILFLFYKPFVTVKFLFNSIYYIIANPYLNISLSFWWLITLIGFYQFFANIKADKTLNKASVIMFLAWAIGFSGGTSTFLPSYGIMAYPMFHIFVCLYVGIMTYGIFYHRLLPINIVIKRSIIYSLLAATTSLIYIFSVLISQQLFRQYFGYSSTIIGSIVIAIAFIPLKNKIQDFVDRFFLKATPLEIAQQNEQLRQEVTESERMKSIAILASGMAHEIKNPLTPIKTFSEQLPSRLDDKEFLLKFSRIINKEVARIDNLVQDLLNYAKPTTPHLESTNICQFIEQILDLLNNDLLAHKIALNTSFEDKNIYINIDPKQIKQALLNIFLNAIDAMPNGGTLTIAACVIPAKVGIHNNQYTITISDTGYGIDPKDLPHIFEPFFTKKDKGTGLGLAITHGIIEKHQGSLEVKSKINQGTTFKIKI